STIVIYSLSLHDALPIYFFLFLQTIFNIFLDYGKLPNSTRFEQPDRRREFYAIEFTKRNSSFSFRDCLYYRLLLLRYCRFNLRYYRFSTSKKRHETVSI